MLDVMQMSMIDPEWQYKVFVNSKVTSDINIDFKDLPKYLAIEEGKLKGLILSDSALSYLILIGHLFSVYFFDLGWKVLFIGFFVFLLSMAVSGKNAKYWYIPIFLILYLIFGNSFTTQYIVIFGFLAWTLQTLSFIVMYKLIFGLLKKDKELFLKCIEGRYLAIYFSDTNLKELEKFMNLEGIKEIPTDKNISKYLSNN